MLTDIAKEPEPPTENLLQRGQKRKVEEKGGEASGNSGGTRRRATAGSESVRNPRHEASRLQPQSKKHTQVWSRNDTDDGTGGAIKSR